MSAAPSLPDEVVQISKTSHDAANGHAQPSADSSRPSLSPVENFRPVKVVVIGAGFSGIYCGIRIPERIRNCELVIYEKNAGVGGTWWENRYPGCACDIPSHSYQYSFNPNPCWSALYAPSKEIRQYLHDTVAAYGADRFIKLSHKVESCRWDAAAGKWHLTVDDLRTGHTFEDSADIIINARGALNDARWPDIPGLKDFKGEVVHSAQWKEDSRFDNKKIGVIGSGSSSIQIVPKMQELPGTHVSVFVRSQTWISPSFGQRTWDKMGIKDFKFSQEQIETFAKDPEALRKFRIAIEEDGNGIHKFTIKGTAEQQGARQVFQKSMKDRLAKRPDIYETLLPSFPPGCRRLTPGPGYLESLTEPNVAFVTCRIKEIEATGIRTDDGKVHALDTLVCATGFYAGAPPAFPVHGLTTTIQDHWKEYPRSYLSLATDGFPNYFTMLGPNSAIGTGSLTKMIESAGDYVVRCVRKVQKDNIKSMTVKRERVDDFKRFAHQYFKQTVYTENCRSWYRNEKGEVTGLWPGSTLHCIESLRSPRWEDYDYEPLESTGGNMLSWLGSGQTINEVEKKDLAWYLYPQFQDIPNKGRPEDSEMFAMRSFSY